MIRFETLESGRTRAIIDQGDFAWLAATLQEINTVIELSMDTGLYPGRYITKAYEQGELLRGIATADEVVIVLAGGENA